MAADKRYAPVTAVPEEVLKNMAADAIFSPGFGIKGHAKSGRASYLVSETLTQYACKGRIDVCFSVVGEIRLIRMM